MTRKCHILILRQTKQLTTFEHLTDKKFSLATYIFVSTSFTKIMQGACKKWGQKYILFVMAPLIFLVREKVTDDPFLIGDQSCKAKNQILNQL